MKRAKGFLVPSRRLERTVKEYIPETAIYTLYKVNINLRTHTGTPYLHGVEPLRS
jgi:hypothetical protein